MSEEQPPPAPLLLTQEGLQICWKALEYYTPLKKVYAWVSDHPHDNLSLEDAASIAGLERTYFSKYFHAKVGVKFKYWTDYVRVKPAAARLRESDNSVLTVGLDCGFTDPTTFTRAFSRVAGTTPGKYRKGCRRMHLLEGSSSKSQESPTKSQQLPTDSQ